MTIINARLKKKGGEPTEVIFYISYVEVKTGCFMFNLGQKLFFCHANF